MRFHNHFHSQRRLRGARTDAESTLWRGFINSIAFPFLLGKALVADSVLSIPHWKEVASPIFAFLSAEGNALSLSGESLWSGLFER